MTGIKPMLLLVYCFLECEKMLCLFKCWFEYLKNLFLKSKCLFNVKMGNFQIWLNSPIKTIYTTLEILAYARSLKDRSTKSFYRSFFNHADALIYKIEIIYYFPFFLPVAYWKKLRQENDKLTHPFGYFTIYPRKNLVYSLLKPTRFFAF